MGGYLRCKFLDTPGGLGYMLSPFSTSVYVYTLSLFLSLFLPLSTWSFSYMGGPKR